MGGECHVPGDTLSAAPCRAARPACGPHVPHLQLTGNCHNTSSCVYLLRGSPCACERPGASQPADCARQRVKSPQQPWTALRLAPVLSQAAGVVPPLSARGLCACCRPPASNPLTLHPSPCQMKKLARRQQQQQDQQNTQRLSSGKRGPSSQACEGPGLTHHSALAGRPLLGSAKPCLHRGQRLFQRGSRPRGSGRGSRAPSWGLGG